MSVDFYKKLQSLRMEVVEGVDPERGIRAYCDTIGATWALQLRSPLRRKTDGEDGKFVVATAYLDAETMRDLRKAITDLLGDAMGGDSVALLNKRVLLTGGMRGRVVAVSNDGRVEVSNELEDDKYRYWCKADEVVQVLEEKT
jgi:hypothetical protein